MQAIRKSDAIQEFDVIKSVLFQVTMHVLLCQNLSRLLTALTDGSYVQSIFIHLIDFARTSYSVGFYREVMDFYLGSGIGYRRRSASTVQVSHAKMERHGKRSASRTYIFEDGACVELSVCFLYCNRPSLLLDPHRACLCPLCNRRGRMKG